MKVQPSDMMSIWNFVESNGHAFSNVGQQEPKFVKLAGKVQKARKKSESDSDGSTATEASLGSLGHPWMCRRPCVYVAAHRASCPQGTNCGYCHLRHPQRRTTFDKRQREYLRNLTEAEMLTVLLPQLKSKALKMRPTAWKVIRILEEKLALAGGQQDLETIPMASLISEATDPWSVLGLSPGASSSEVRRAFRARARLWHPDRGGDPERFQALSQAYAHAMNFEASTESAEKATSSVRRRAVEDEAERREPTLEACSLYFF
eukprot:g24101.t1